MENQTIYLDHASTSHPKPPELLEGINYYLENIGANPGRGSYGLTENAEDIVHSTREKLAEILNIPYPSHIAFTLNATHALNILIKGYLKQGDHVLISNYEHNSVVRPLHKMQKQGIIDYSVFPCEKDGSFKLDQMISMIREETKLIIINHASNVLGTISPIKQICQIAKANGIPVALDVAQTAGIIPVDAEELDLDFIAGTGHKGLLGPSGIGFLYAKDFDLVDSLYEGGSGLNSFSRNHPGISPSKFEAGTLNYLGIAGLNYTLGHLKKHGYETYYNRSMQLVQLAMDQLVQMPGVTVYGSRRLEDKIPIISFNVEGYYPAEVSYLLDQNHICVRAGLHCAPLIHELLETAPYGTVRMSLGHQNTEVQILKFLQTIKDIAEKKISSQGTSMMDLEMMREFSA